MQRLVFILACLAPFSAPCAAPVERIVGVAAPEGGATLVKRVHVSAGDEITGIVLLSNDVATIFPAVHVRRTERYGAGATIVEAHAVRSTGGTHRIIVAVDPVLFVDAQDLIVEIELPPTDGVVATGRGAGLGAMVLATNAPTSFTGHVGAAELQPLDVDLCISLLRSADTVAGKAGPGRRGAEQKGSEVPTLELAGLPGGDPEIEVSLPGQGSSTLNVYDVRGRVVRCLLDVAVGPRTQRVVWDRRDAGGAQVASGMYVLVARSNGREVAKKALVLR